jgi:hypothetical protein
VTHLGAMDTLRVGSERVEPAADHLYGVEVVVVDAAGAARSVVATREPSDPNRDLWWAHTGGGGGNFGVVTPYWFRSPGARAGDPAALLPKAPDSMLTFRVAWSWEDIDAAATPDCSGSRAAGTRATSSTTRYPSDPPEAPPCRSRRPLFVV